MTDQTLLALAERCEQASGPCPKLNAEVLHGLGWSETPEGDVLRPDGSLAFDVPYVLASLDAAMTLVPEGWGWNVSQPNEKALASGLLKERTPVLGEVQYGCDHRYAVAAASAALALCAAALRAHAAILADKGG